MNNITIPDKHGDKKMNTTHVAFFDAKPFDREFFNAANKHFDFAIKYYNNHLTSDTVVLTEGFDAVCVFVNDDVNEEVITGLVKNNIKLVALRCAGYNNVDFKAAYRKVHVVRVPEYSPYAVAEHAVALMLSLNRKIHRAYYRTRDSNFNIVGLLGFDMYGKTVGIIGTGKIGKILIKILKGFNMNVLAYDIYPDRTFEKEIGFNYVDIKRLYNDSDIISLNCPLTQDTYHIINRASIQEMKDGVMIVNTGRGRLIDTKALVKGLKSGKIGAAGLDVYEEESTYFFEDFSTMIINDDVLARLLTFPNVLITSHQGFFTREALTNIAEITLHNIADFFSGKELVNEICYQCSEEPCRKKETGRCF